MKIEKLTLKELEVREIDGEYESVFFNEKNYPIFLTNYALKKGKEKGYIETSLFGELAKLGAMDKARDSKGDFDASAIGGFDETSALKVIYLAFLGANKNTGIDYERFLELYHYGIEETLVLYAKLIENLVSTDKNRFAKEFEKATEKSKKNF